MALIASAAGPWIAGAVVESFGPDGTLALLAMLSVVPVALTAGLWITLRRDIDPA